MNGGEETGRREMEEMNVTDGAVEVEMEDGEIAMEMGGRDGDGEGKERRKGRNGG